MKNTKFLTAFSVIIALLAACQKNNAVKPGSSNINLKKTTAVTPPLCTGDTAKQLVKFINGAGFIAGVTSATDSAGDIYTLGNYNGNYDFDPGTGVANLPDATGTFLQKINADGTFAWVNELASSNGSNHYFSFSMQVDKTGNIYVSSLGFPSSPSGNSSGLYNATKFNTAGTRVWFYEQSAGQINSTPLALVLDTYGNVYLCGIYSAYNLLDPEPIPFGNMFLNGTGTFVEELNSNGIFVGVIKTDSLVQNPVFSPKGALYDYGKNTDGSQYLRAFDHNAHLLWTNQLGGNLISKLITDNAGNAIVVCGANTYPYSNTPEFNQNSQLGKYDANGNLLFRYVNCGASNVITTNAAGNIFMEGFLTGTQDVDPTPGQYFLSTANPYGAFYIREFDGAGNFAGAKLQPTGTPEFATIQSMAADASGYIYFSGNAGNSQTNLFVTKYSQCY